MDVNPIVNYGFKVGSILGVNQYSKMKWLKLFILYLPFSTIIVFNIISLFEGDTDLDNVVKITFNILIYWQVSLVLEDRVCTNCLMFI